MQTNHSTHASAAIVSPQIDSVKLKRAKSNRSAAAPSTHSIVVVTFIRLKSCSVLAMSRLQKKLFMPKSGPAGGGE